MNIERRRIVHKLLIGTAALAGSCVLPDKWITPMARFGTLPAHATTSDLADLERKIKKIIEDNEDIILPEENEAEKEEVPEKLADKEVPVKEEEPEPVKEVKEPAKEPEKKKTEPVQEEPKKEEPVQVPDDKRGYANKLTIAYTGARMSCDKVLQDKIVFPKLGPQYAATFLLVWSDGNELLVPNSEHMAMKGEQNDYRKYQPGGRYSHYNPDIPTMEVYARRGTHPTSVTLYY